jgi:hypothetical protein
MEELMVHYVEMADDGALTHKIDADNIAFMRTHITDREKGVVAHLRRGGSDDVIFLPSSDPAAYLTRCFDRLEKAGKGLVSFPVRQTGSNGFEEVDRLHVNPAAIACMAASKSCSADGNFYIVLEIENYYRQQSVALTAAEERALREAAMKAMPQAMRVEADYMKSRFSDGYTILDPAKISLIHGRHDAVLVYFGPKNSMDFSVPSALIKQVTDNFVREWRQSSQSAVNDLFYEEHDKRQGEAEADRKNEFCGRLVKAAPRLYHFNSAVLHTAADPAIVDDVRAENAQWGDESNVKTISLQAHFKRFMEHYPIRYPSSDSRDAAAQDYYEESARRQSPGGGPAPSRNMP